MQVLWRGIEAVLLSKIKAKLQMILPDTFNKLRKLISLLDEIDEWFGLTTFFGTEYTVLI